MSTLKTLIIQIIYFYKQLSVISLVSVSLTHLGTLQRSHEETEKGL